MGGFIMASIISAGTTSGTALNMTADTSGALQLATGASATTAVTIDTSQNTTFAKSIILNGSTSGTVTVAAPAVSGTNTLTLPALTGTVQIGGPAFSAYKSSGNQSITSGTFTKVTYDVENFDTNNNFASSRFTPTVAGYYQINAGLSVETSSTITRVLITIYKNGAEYTRGTDILAGNAVFVGDVIYFNGTTDYIEIYVYATGTGLVVRAQPFNMTYFSGCFLRSA
jgi:hypothetical protein